MVFVSVSAACILGLLNLGLALDFLQTQAVTPSNRLKPSLELLAWWLGFFLLMAGIDYVASPSFVVTAFYGVITSTIVGFCWFNRCILVP